MASNGNAGSEAAQAGRVAVGTKSRANIRTQDARAKSAIPLAKRDERDFSFGVEFSMRSGLPASSVTNARSGVPRQDHDFVETLLNPDGVSKIEVHDGTQRFTVVEVILDVLAAGQAGDAELNPCVARHDLCLRQAEIFHDAPAFSVGAVVGMPKAGAGVFVGVGKCELIAERVFLEKSEGVADADVVVGFG